VQQSVITLYNLLKKHHFFLEKKKYIVKVHSNNNRIKSGSIVFDNYQNAEKYFEQIYSEFDKLFRKK